MDTVFTEDRGYSSELQERIDIVLFDYGQVLSAPPDPEAWARMMAITRLNQERLHEGYWALRHDYDRGQFTGREYWCALANREGISLHKPQIDALLIADVDLWARPNPPMITWADVVQRAGLRTAVLSNIGDAMAAGLTARLPWLHQFERCIWSYALRLAKPEREIFRRSSEMLNTAPQTILFIDDKEENIAAARREGMQAIHYVVQEQFECEMRARGFGPLLDVARAV